MPDDENHALTYPFRCQQNGSNIGVQMRGKKNKREKQGKRTQEEAKGGDLPQISYATTHERIRPIAKKYEKFFFKKPKEKGPSQVLLCKIH